MILVYLSGVYSYLFLTYWFNFSLFYGIDDEVYDFARYFVHF